jgi:hypothetical protein
MSPVRICVPLPRRLRRQLARLGFTTVSDYDIWCEAHGFELGPHKSWEVLEREWCVRAAELREAARRERVDRDPVALLARVCAGQARASDFGRPAWRNLAERVEHATLDREARLALRELVECADRRGQLALAEGRFGDERLPFLQGLIALAECHRVWRRRPQAWRPRSHNGRRQFAALLRHLVARYPVPAFLDGAWLRADAAAERYRAWYLRVGNGERLAGVWAPVRLTRRVAHHFLQAPETDSIEHALRRAQVLALGGDEALVRAVLESRLGRGFEHEEFWLSVIAYFIQHPELARLHVAPIIDFLHDQRFVPQRVFVAPGVRVERAPVRPHFTMRGRSVPTLLREVEAWHASLGRGLGKKAIVWPASDIRPLEWETGTRGKDLCVWRIRELLSAHELNLEGQAMRHCVVIYLSSCRSGACSVWSLECESFERVRKLLTLRVNSARTLVECRGRANRLPRAGEVAVLRRWVQREGLATAPYLGFAL